MRKFKLIFVLLAIFSLPGCGSDPSVGVVKDGTLGLCEEKTVGQMADSFMDSPSWKSIVADDGNTYVNLEGGILLHDRPTTALIQFAVDVDSGLFEFNALEFNAVPQDLLTALALLEAMCEE